MTANLDRVVQRTAQSIENLQATADATLSSLSAACDLVCQTFLNDGKLLVCGNGPSAATGQLFCAYLLHRYTLDRPALPAINLSNNSALISQIGTESSINDIYAKPIQALAQSHDLLVVFSHGNKIGSLVQAIQAAHTRQLPILAFSCREGEDIQALLTGRDIDLSVPTSGSLAIEAHTMLVHRLCEMIDLTIFDLED